MRDQDDVATVNGSEQERPGPVRDGTSHYKHSEPGTRTTFTPQCRTVSRSVTAARSEPRTRSASPARGAVCLSLLLGRCTSGLSGQSAYVSRLQLQQRRDPLGGHDGYQPSHSGGQLGRRRGLLDPAVLLVALPVQRTPPLPRPGQGH